MAKSFSLGETIKFGWDTWKEKWVFFAGLTLIPLLLWGISMILPMGAQVQKGISAGWVMMSILLNLVNLAVGLGIMKVYLGVVDSGKGSYRDFLGFAPYFVKYLLAILLLVLIYIGMALVFAALAVLAILLFRPQGSQLLAVVFPIFGVMMVLLMGALVKIQFFPYLVVDQGLGPVKAVKRSWSITRGVFWRLILFGVTLFLMQLPSLLGFMSWGLSSQGGLSFHWSLSFQGNDLQRLPAWVQFISLLYWFVATPVTALAYAKVYRILNTDPETTEPVAATPAETM